MLDTPTSPEAPEKRKASAVEIIKEVSRLYFENNPSAQIICSHDTGLVAAINKAAQSLFRIPDNTIVGRSLGQLYHDPDGHLHVFTEEAAIRGYAWNRELNLFRPDGSSLNLEHLGVSAQIGDETFIVITINDLDALKVRTANEEANNLHRKGIEEWKYAESFFREMEKQNQLILSAAGEGIYGVGVDGCTTFLNPAAEKMLGYNAEELVGKDMHSIIHHHKPDGSHYPEEECPIYNAYRMGKKQTVEDEIFWCKDNSPLHVEYTSTPIMDSGDVIGAVIVFRNISERKKREKELREALKENAELRERLEQENAYLIEEIHSHINHYNIIGASSETKRILSQIDLVGPTEANVLITGESGTGKELVARAIHQASPRSHRPLISVNCAAISKDLFESEFFGHVKGAFTGALRDRIGRFELANGGTIFLDEVGEIPLELQSKLLRVIQDHTFERIGEEKTREVDIRIIAATNRDLKKESSEGRFREDLYFRLNVFPIKCTPLRERHDDIGLLAEHFLELACKKQKIKKPQLTKSNIKTLKNHHWPGNARELQNIMERAAILAQNGRINFNLPLQNKPDISEIKDTNVTEGPDENTVLTHAEMQLLEVENIKKALHQCSGRVSGENGAAQLLKMAPTTLYSRIKAMKINHTSD